MTDNQKELISYHRDKLYNSLECFKVFLQSNKNYKLAELMQKNKELLNEVMYEFSKNGFVNEDEWVLKFKNFCKNIIKEI